MAETIKLKISRTVAAYVRPGLTTEDKLTGLENAAGFKPFDRLTLIFCLLRDADSVVKAAANTAFFSLPDEELIALAGSSDLHPAMLDAIARSHHERTGIAEALLKNEQLSASARSFLQKAVQQQAQNASAVSGEAISAKECETVESPDQADVEGDGNPEDTDDIPQEEPDAAAAEDGEEFLSKYKMAQEMGIAEKIKMALTGDKEWRSILVKDANKLVSGGVIKNPRITEAEVVTLLKSGIQNDEIMRLICANKEWVKNYAIRKALVDNNRTPIQNSLRYLTTLSDKDIAGYAKSKNVSSVISTQAKRIMATKKR